MRTQDVKLMKQLIGINESIRNLTKSRQQRTSTGARVVSTSDFAAMATPLVRQQSAPSYNKLHRNDSMGSIESSEGRNQWSHDKSYCQPNLFEIFWYFVWIQFLSQRNIFFIVFFCYLQVYLHDCWTNSDWKQLLSIECC